MKHRLETGKLISVLLIGFLLFVCGCGSGGSGGSGGGSETRPAGDDPPVVTDDRISLAINETAGVARSADPVTSGVPFPPGTVFSIEDLAVVDSESQPVPAQFKVLSRWDGSATDPSKAIKWVLVDFQADVPASGAAGYFLDYSGSVSNPAHDTPVQILVDNEEGMDLSTGPLEFGISKTGFNLFDYVRLDGMDVIQHSQENGIWVMGEGAKMFLSSRSPVSVEVEHAGPLRTTLKVEGRHIAGDSDELLSFTVRIGAFAGKEFLQVDYILENNGCYHFSPYGASTSHEYFLLLGLVTQLELGENKTISFEDYSDQFTGHKNYRLVQDQAPLVPFETVAATKFFRKIFKNGGEVFSRGPDSMTGRTNGFVDLSDANLGLAVGVRNFWENFPKAVRVLGRSLVIELWPAGYHGPEYTSADGPGYQEDEKSLQYYRLDGGRHKGYELCYFFHHGGTDTAQLRNQILAFQSPLFAKAEGRWFAQCNPLSIPFVEERDWADSEVLDSDLATQFVRFDRWASVMADESVGETNIFGKHSLYTYKLNGGSYPGERQFFGWPNFGDLAWAHGFCSNHYDWAFGLLWHFMRKGDPGLLRLGLEHARHRRDFDQYYSNTDAVAYSGGMFNEMGNNHGNDWEPNPSHQWTHGLLLAYLLTGDEEYMDAVRMVMEQYYTSYIQTFWSDGWGLDGQARTAGWTLAALVEMYSCTYDQDYLELARLLIHGMEGSYPSGILNVEDYSGKDGHILYPSSRHIGSASIWQNGILAKAMCDFYFADGEQDEEVKSYILRFADWLTRDTYPDDSLGNPNNPIRGGWDAVELYMPRKVVRWWRPDGQYGSGPWGEHDEFAQEMAHNTFVIDPLACAAMLAPAGPKKEKYKNAARNIFSDTVKYLGASAGNTIDPQDYTVVNFAITRFYSSESKVLGWLNRMGGYYLQMEVGE